VMHSGLPHGGLGNVKRSPVRFGFHTLSGGKESDGNRLLAGKSVGRANDHVGHVGCSKVSSLALPY
jgi:hypothetical protein